MTDRTQLLEAALHLRAPALKPFVDWLKTERNHTLEQLSTVAEQHLLKLQGDAQRLAKILKLIEDASSELQKK